MHRRQAARVTPAQVLAQYRRDRFTGPTSTDPTALAEFDRFAFDTLRARGYTPVELSPVAPLDTVSALSPLNQNLVLTTARGTELVADSTNVLALESAVRRSGRELTGLDEVRVTVTDLSGRRALLAEHVLAPVARTFPRVDVDFDDEREKGRGYYVDACFDISARGISFADGGFTTWTRQLLGNAKERLLTGGLGVDMLHSNFGLPKVEL